LKTSSKNFKYKYIQQIKEIFKMGKFNLSEAAKAILSEGAKETLEGSVKSKMSQRSSDKHVHGEVGEDRLKSSTAYGTNDAGDIGSSPEEETDALPDYTKGTPSATPPGATPPVGSEKNGVGITKPKGQPQETVAGHTAVQEPATHMDAIRDRIAGKLAKQTMQMNPGATFQSYGEETETEGNLVSEEEHADEKEDKKLIKKMINKAKLKEDIDALLEGEGLSEEFATKATTIFEAAVLARAEEVVALAEAEMMEQFEAAVEEIKEDLASKVDDYLNYMVEEWIKDNEIAIESGLRAEITEEFIDDLRNLFIEHNIDIPAEKVDIVEGLAAQVEDLEAALNEQIARGIELTKALNEQKKIEAIYTVCEGLTQTQVEKLKSLAEGVEFTTEEEFGSKLSTLKESYFKSDVKVADSSSLDEILVEEDQTVAKSVDPLMDAYSKTISKSLK
jgi:hypothetical protein